jgi:lysine 2,3-aminomutase
MADILDYGKEDLVGLLWKAHPRIMGILRDSDSLRDCRRAFFDYLNRLENHYFNIYSDKAYKSMHILERNNAKECIRVLKNIIRTENESLTKTSALKILRKIAKGRGDYLERVDEGFILEFIHLFRGVRGESGIRKAIYTTSFEHPVPFETAKARSDTLDGYANEMEKWFSRYLVGYDPTLREKQLGLRDKILDFFGGVEGDWADWRWHLDHVIKDSDTLESIVNLSPAEVEGLRLADEYGIAYHITPHYLSLFDPAGKAGYDRVVRAQVLPSRGYCINVEKSRRTGESLDFMDEGSTSPVSRITRRYPQILILKPFDSCPQICVYCQRNWEIKGLESGVYDELGTDNAISWIRDNKHITEVLVTGGDPLTLDNDRIEGIIGKLSGIGHVQRIRIGTRTLVTLPQRIDDGLVRLLDRHYDIGVRDISVMTHFEHPTEFTLDCLEAVKRIKRLGISIYNQQVYTYYTSRKFEASFLRKILKKSGIEPYYTFNTKGKGETVDYRVPIARIEQERKEEARLLPGLDRMDRPVFNVPRLGKSNLRGWQDHEPIMIMPDGSRVYRFYPWESKLAQVEDYIYTDVPIYGYLRRLKADGEDLGEYGSIWYYF